MTANKNTAVSFESMRELHHDWAKGIKKGTKVVFHPYTRKGFRFGENTNEL